MYAVIESGGRQVRVQEGKTVRVDRIAGSPGDAITLDRVLLVSKDDGPTLGMPTVDGAKVTARIVRQGRGRKIRVFKYRSKSHYRRRQGHRQDFTELKIEKIEV